MFAAWPHDRRIVVRDHLRASGIRHRRLETPDRRGHPTTPNAGRCGGVDKRAVFAGRRRQLNGPSEQMVKMKVEEDTSEDKAAK